MIIETYSFNSRPQIDDTNSRLNGVVIMSTDFNLNKNAVFTSANQSELVEMGNANKVYCYLGHAKQGSTSEDRLPFRLGYFSNWRVDGSTVKADLIISPTADDNPILAARHPEGMKKYIFALAENESSECGFSMSIGMAYNDDDTVSILALYSVDLVEDPALTLGMFSKNNEEIIQMDDVNPLLTSAYDTFSALNDAINAGSDYETIADSLIAQINALITSADSNEAADFDTSAAPDATSAVEAQSEDVSNTTIAAQLQALQELIQAFIANQSDEDFSKKEIKDEAKEEKKVVFSIPAPINVDAGEKTIDDHRKEYQKLRAEGKYSEAAKYFSKNIK